MSARQERRRQDDQKKLLEADICRANPGLQHNEDGRWATMTTYTHIHIMTDTTPTKDEATG
jgi:hypothetical protein